MPETHSHPRHRRGCSTRATGRVERARIERCVELCSMAKLGQGDARWIVDEREDGTNVHGWHWAEKDVAEWAKERLQELLGDQEVLRGEGGCWLRIDQLHVFRGDAFINQRKGKFIPGYELEVALQWTGEIKGQGNDPPTGVASASGEIKIPYIGDENHDEDSEIQVTVFQNGPVENRLREAMLAKGIPVLQKGIRTFHQEMWSGKPINANGAVKKDAAPSQEKKQGQVEAEAKEDVKELERKKKEEASEFRTIKLRENFHARPKDIYDAYLDENRVKAFTQSNASISKEVGGEFSLFNGSIVGKQVELVPCERIVQKWRFSNWPQDHYSTVTITITEKEPGNTQLRLVQTEVPVADQFGNESVLETTERGWKEQVWNRIRAVFGYGI